MAYWRSRTKTKTVHVEVKIDRSSYKNSRGRYFYEAIACVRSRQSKGGARMWNGEHCSGLRGGASPTEAVRNSLRELGEHMTSKASVKRGYTGVRRKGRR